MRLLVIMAISELTKNTCFIGIVTNVLEIDARFFIDIKILRKDLGSQAFNTNSKR